MIRRALGLPPTAPARRRPTVAWFAGHFTTDGCPSGLGPACAAPVLVVVAKERSPLLTPWRRCWGGAINGGVNRQGQRWHCWQLTEPTKVLALAARLRRVYRHWRSPKDRRLALLPLAYALRDCGAHRRNSTLLYPYWRQLLGLWQLRQVGQKLLLVGGRGRLAAARPLAQQLRRSLQRPGQPEGTRWRRLVALWHALPVEPALRPGRRWRTALVQILDLADPLLGPVLAAAAAGPPQRMAHRPQRPTRPALGRDGPLGAALLDAAGRWVRRGPSAPARTLRLQLALPPEQRPLALALAAALGVAPPTPRTGCPRAAQLRWLGPRMFPAALVVAALPHCRVAVGPPPVGWAAGAPLPPKGAAVAAETAEQRGRWLLTVALLRGRLRLEFFGGGWRPSLSLAAASGRGFGAAAEGELLAAVAVALPGAEVVDSRSLRWQGAALAPLAEALASYPLPLGGRWPLLPEALALAALAPEDAAAPGRRREFRRRWRQLPDGCAPGRRSHFRGAPGKEEPPRP